jgi:hypothetical protein
MSTIGGVSSTAVQPAAETQAQQQIQAAKAELTSSSPEGGSKNAKATVQSNINGLNLIA